MKYEAVIFDLDGVICHTDNYHFQAWKALADSLGIPFDEAVNNRLRGVSRMDSLEIILEKYNGILSREQKIAYAEKKNNLYKAFLQNMSSADLSPVVKQTLDTLRQRGIKLAIGSSSKNAGFILGQLGLKGYFDAVSDGNNITNSKPDPEVFCKAAEYLGIPAEKCLVVEDAVAGVQAAHAAGMSCAAVGDAALSHAADYELKDFSDLLQVCE